MNVLRKGDTMDFQIYPLGDTALMIEFHTYDKDLANDYVHSSYHYLNMSQLQGVISMVPAYTTLTIHYDPCSYHSSYPFEAIKNQLQNLLATKIAQTKYKEQCFFIPVCYEQPFALDLSSVAIHNQLTELEVIKLHSSQIYHVSFIGFSPGFPFLRGLHSKIATPRKDSPRLNVTAGSVGIAGIQTGIYPTDSPGGWQIIGKTPLPIYFPDKGEPTLFSPGDLIRFYPITVDGFYRMEELYEHNCT